MTILNRRNAFIGWTAWQVGKWVVKRKAKDVVPRPPARSSANRYAVALGAAAGAAALALWLKRRRDDTVDSYDPSA
jgi:hypothetical protein